MTHHYDGEYRKEQEEKPIVERFKIIGETIMMDGKEISISDLVNISNQLASALNDRGCYFEVKK